MTVLRQRMLADLQLAGLKERTQEAYLRAVRHLAAYLGQSCDTIDKAQLRDYFLYLKNEKRCAPRSAMVDSHLSARHNLTSRTAHHRFAPAFIRIGYKCTHADRRVNPTKSNC